MCASRNITHDRDLYRSVCLTQLLLLWARRAIRSAAITHSTTHTYIYLLPHESCSSQIAACDTSADIARIAGPRGHSRAQRWLFTSRAKYSFIVRRWWPFDSGGTCRSPHGLRARLCAGDAFSVIVRCSAFRACPRDMNAYICRVVNHAGLRAVRF